MIKVNIEKIQEAKNIQGIKNINNSDSSNKCDYGQVLKEISKNISFKNGHKDFLESTFKVIAEEMSLTGVYLINHEEKPRKIEYVSTKQGKLFFMSKENSLLTHQIYKWYEERSIDRDVVTCNSIIEEAKLLDIDELEANNIQSFIIAPVYRHQEKIALVCFTKDMPYNWNKDEINMLCAICLLMNLELANEAMNRQLVYETQKLEHLSKFDERTSLYNRSYIEKNFDCIDCEDSYPLAVVMGDLNGLKFTNDTYGYMAGDSMLSRAGCLIKMVVGELGIAGRWGGDEFLIILPEFDEEKTCALCNKIEMLFKSSTPKQSYNSLSLGYAIKRNKHVSKSRVIREAEDYMYKKKLLESRSLHAKIVSFMQRALHEKTCETESHSLRMLNISKKIACYMGVSTKELEDLKLVALLHNIGKITVSKDILEKRDCLTPDEWKIIKGHPQSGYRILKAVPELAHIAEYVLYHHERWDGLGYEGIAKEEIPLLSRIIAVTDAYDAMTHDRSYRKALSEEEAIQELIKNAGTQFDPGVVIAFINVINMK